MIQEKNVTSGLSRRDMLLVGLSASAAALAPMRLFAQENLPTELPGHIQFFREAQRSTTLDKDGQNQTIVPMEKGDILLVMAQKLRLGGEVWDVFPAQNPGSTIAWAIAASNDIPFGVRYSQYPESTVWTSSAKTQNENPTWNELVADADIVARVQGSRGYILGNCLPGGCSEVRVVTLIAEQVANEKVNFARARDQVFKNPNA